MLVMNVVSQDEKARRKRLEEDIKRKVAKANHDNDNTEKNS